MDDKEPKPDAAATPDVFTIKDKPLGPVSIYADDTWVAAVMPDSRLTDEEAEELAEAARLGYSDVGAMARERLPVHSVLCYALGLDDSPAIRADAEGQPASEITDAEVAMVAAAQRFLNLCRAARKTG